MTWWSCSYVVFGVETDWPTVWIGSASALLGALAGALCAYYMSRAIDERRQLLDALKQIYSRTFRPAFDKAIRTRDQFPATAEQANGLDRLNQETRVDIDESFALVEGDARFVDRECRERASELRPLTQGLRYESNDSVDDARNLIKLARAATAFNLYLESRIDQVSRTRDRVLKRP